MADEQPKTIDAQFTPVSNSSVEQRLQNLNCVPDDFKIAGGFYRGLLLS